MRESENSLIELEKLGERESQFSYRVRGFGGEREKVRNLKEISVEWERERYGLWQIEEFSERI